VLTPDRESDSNVNSSGCVSTRHEGARSQKHHAFDGVKKFNPLMNYENFGRTESFKSQSILGGDFGGGPVWRRQSAGAGGQRRVDD
jgi:hypothetical protein